MLAHRFEVAVVVQQGMPVLDAERADDQVRQFKYRAAQTTQVAIIRGGLHGKAGA